MIQVEQLELIRGGRRLLQDAELRVPDGHKVGLVGANGCGKSSLMALLRGTATADNGSVYLPQGWRIGWVAQETPALDTPAISYVLEGDVEYQQIQHQLSEAEQAQDGHTIAVLHDKLATIDGYSIQARAATILHGLGFRDEQLNEPVRTFSGGWRMRLNLAQALIARADLLLLDEPTNHLDLDAVIWLENWLQRFTGTLLLISHDRAFLDNIVDSIAHIEQQKINWYRGNYTSFERQRAERLAQQQQQYEKQQQQRAHLQAYVDRFRAQATKAKQAQSRLKMLARMEELAPARIDHQFEFSIPKPQQLPDPLLKVEHAQLGYEDHVILKDVSLRLSPGTRLGLLGPNGAGKSTFIKCLAGLLTPQSGLVEPHEHLKIGYFAQHQLEQLDGEASPLLQLQRLAPKATEQELRNYLGGFAFRGDDALRTAGGMSGGERARLALALLCWQAPNLLLLDEPTNHLDLDMRQALTLALQDYPGALVVVSHDRDLISSTADELWLVADHHAQPFDGDMDDYRLWLAQHQQEVVAPPTDTVRPGVDRKVQKRLEAEFRQQVRPIKKLLEQIESSMAAKQRKRADMELTLADPELYQSGDKDTLTALLAAKGKLDSELDSLELQWLEVQEQLEQHERDFRASSGLD